MLVLRKKEKNREGLVEVTHFVEFLRKHTGCFGIISGGGRRKLNLASGLYSVVT
jgi:hypothetical protein